VVAVYLLMAVVGAAAAIFALQNIDPVVIRFLGWRIDGAPLSIVIMLSMVVGIVLTSLVGVVRHWKLRSQIRRLENRLTQLSASPPPPPVAATPRTDTTPRADQGPR
jgi:uncharacterized integral membrane protein